MNDERKKDLYLSSDVAPLFKKEYDNYDLMNVYMYLDCLKKHEYSLDIFHKNNIKLTTPDYGDLTVVISFNENRDPYIDRNVDLLFNYYKSLGIKNVIVVENDLYQKGQWIKNRYNTFFTNLKLLFLKSTGDYNRSKAINYALKQVETTYVLITDFNCMISKEIFNNSFVLLDSFYDFVYPFDKKIVLIDDCEEIDSEYTMDYVMGQMNESLNYEGYMLFCRKKSLFKIGGYNPEFVTSIGENNELNMRINLSDCFVHRFNSSLYYLNSLPKRSTKDDVLIMNRYNLSKFRDINMFINGNKDMYFNSKYYTKDYELKTLPDKYKISVIIPIYNCEYFYLDRCISSLQNQTIGFENIEVIIVDDASKFRESKELIKLYDEKYENIKAIFLDVNSGSGRARNIGIKYATADYITFLDHDDYFVSTNCEIAYAKIKKYDADLFISNYVNLTIKRNYLMDWDYLELNDDDKYIENYHENHNIFKIPPSIWAKTYRRKFLLDKNVLFDNFRVGQDLVFNEKVLFNAEGIVLYGGPAMVYSFRENEKTELQSISLSNNKMKLMTLLDVYAASLNNFNKYYPEEALFRLHRSLNYWTQDRLYDSVMNINDFIEVVDKAQHLFKSIIDVEDIKIQNRFKELYSCIANLEYERAYDIYQKKRKKH